MKRKVGLSVAVAVLLMLPLVVSYVVVVTAPEGEVATTFATALWE